MRKIAIIGGGASGLMAAVAASKASKAATHITIFEQADRVGKSILASGNGRCNFSNAAVQASDYYHANFVVSSFEALPPEQVLGFFKDLGLLWHEEGEGRLYPITNKASSVLDVLRFAAECARVEFFTGKTVRAITPIGNVQTRNEQADDSQADGAQADKSKTGKRFLILLEDGSISFFDSVIVACGGKVTRSLLPASYLFHNTQAILGPLRTDTQDIRGLNNLRVRCAVSIEQGTLGEAQEKDAEQGVDAGRHGLAKETSHVESGEVLFRDYGVSGIAVFNLSRFVSAGDTLRLDFFPTMNSAELEAMLRQRAHRLAGRSALSYCAGMLQQTLARAVLRKAGIEAEEPLALTPANVPSAPPKALSDTSKESSLGNFFDPIVSLTQTLKEFPLTVQEIEDYRQCQVHRGAFDTQAFNPKTLESKTDSGLFVVGEALDVDGPCGGFNLHWAWTTGIIAGRAAVLEEGTSPSIATVSTK